MKFIRWFYNFGQYCIYIYIYIHIYMCPGRDERLQNAFATHNTNTFCTRRLSRVRLLRTRSLYHSKCIRYDVRHLYERFSIGSFLYHKVNFCYNFKHHHWPRIFSNILLQKKKHIEHVQRCKHIATVQ